MESYLPLGGGGTTGNQEVQQFMGKSSLWSGYLMI